MAAALAARILRRSGGLKRYVVREVFPLIRAITDADTIATAA